VFLLDKIYVLFYGTPWNTLEHLWNTSGTPDLLGKMRTEHLLIIYSFNNIYLC